jgi:Zn-dependent alcohol dehydrogenase
MPGMKSGDIMGHEFMGEVVEVGATTRKLKVGDRVVVPFTIVCGECEQCRRGNFSVCERTNRNAKLAEKVFGHTTAGLFGYTHLTGGYPGGQAEYVRVPFADVDPVKVPEGLSDEQVLFLGDILPTGWQAAVPATSSRPTRSRSGARPGRAVLRSAARAARRQAGDRIDRVPERLAMARGRRRDHRSTSTRRACSSAERADRTARGRRSASTRSAWRRTPRARSIRSTTAPSRR